AAFGDLDLETFGRKVRIGQHPQQLLSKPRITKLDRRNVDRHGQARIPFFGVTQRLVNQAFREFADDLDFLGDRDEDVWADYSELRRYPSGQHFKSDEVAGFEIDLLFVIRHKLACRD